MAGEEIVMGLVAGINQKVLHLSKEWLPGEGS